MLNLCYTNKEFVQKECLIDDTRRMYQKSQTKGFLTQSAFADELSVSLSTVSRWEADKSKPNLVAMKEIKNFCSKYSLPYNAIEVAWLNQEDNTNE